MALLDGCGSREILEVATAPLLSGVTGEWPEPCSPAVQGKLTGVHLAVPTSSGSLPILEHQRCWALATSSASPAEGTAASGFSQAHLGLGCVRAGVPRSSSEYYGTSLSS